eukprot:TRINITY_DN3119_c0_g1_i1.p1 TRINITY_DN3119_c0_g1~~TRINITY_DN3119_c0_g1_i1.p1  ORF type:complete len:156 (+),score=22.51 TRINITY_DN3119_c0_g1_i1:185-652(+)
MEKIWHHCLYNEIGCAPENHPILMAEVSQTPTTDREKITQTLFEQFNVPALYFAAAPLLGMYASGPLTGIAVSGGYEVSNIVPIYEGHALQHSTRTLYPNGKSLTEHMVKLIAERGFSFTSPAMARIIARDIKEKLCFAAQDLMGRWRKQKTIPA